MSILNFIISELIKFVKNYYILIGIILIAYLIATYYYKKKIKNTLGCINIAPILVKGEIPEALGSYEAGLILQFHLYQICTFFLKKRRGHESFYIDSAVGDRFKGMSNVLMLNNLHKSIFPVLDDLKNQEVKIPEKLTVKIGPAQIPISSIISMFSMLFKWLPIPNKKKYLSSLIHITIVSCGKETQLLVYKHRKGKIKVDNFSEDSMIKKGGTKFKSKTIAGQKDKSKKNHIKACSIQENVLSITKKIDTLAELNNLIHDAGFMVIQLYGEIFQDKNGQSMRSFFDGINSLDNFRRLGEKKCLLEAEGHFALAAELDMKNYIAQYYYGSLLLIKRKPISIRKAIKVFNKAERTEDSVLKGLVYSGLAICHAQKIHRLADCDLNSQEYANKYVIEAKNLLRKHESKAINAWVMAVEAQVIHADEGTKENRNKIILRFLKAANLYCKAISYDPENGVYYNNLGWVILKLAEWGVEELKESSFTKYNVSYSARKIKSLIQGETYEMAERFLRSSLSLNPQNKLSHANLCLLYANRFYRDKDRNKYLYRCRFYGLKGVAIDKEYINGYRDLAVSLIRYKELEEAFTYFQKALLFAIEIEKDLEIISDVEKAFDEMEIPTEQKYLWFRKSNSDLLRPPD